MTSAATEARAEPASEPVKAPALSARSLCAGMLLAMLLCGVNSYLTLSFGVIEEGPTIAALFFFAFFFLAKSKITTTEMAIVATMGSAGGSLGFISNFYAAQVMVGASPPLWRMVAFAAITSLLGLAFVLPLRELLVIKEKLPWPGAKAVESVIRSLVEHGDRRQPAILLVTGVLAMAYVIANDDGGFGLVPAETPIALFGLARFGAAIAWSPFATAGSYLMGMRTCVGFLVGGAALLVMAPHLPEPAEPHHYIWPGIAFLVATGLTSLALGWRVVVDALKSVARLRPSGDDEVISKGAAVRFTLLALAAVVAFSSAVLHLNALLILLLVVVGGLLQNLIAVRAQAQTAFNPARVMGVLLQGACALAGGRAAAVNLTGAGFVAGSGSQAGMLTSDMVYGRALGVPPRWQFWTQLGTVLPCAAVSGWVFEQIQAQKPLTLTGQGLPAPVAKGWAAAAQIFDGTAAMPHFAAEAMLIAAALGVVYVLLEQRLQRFMPCSIGIGIGMVLPVSYDLSFFVGGFIMWIVLRRWLKVSDITLTTVAVACIVAEGIGGMCKPLLSLAGILR